MQNTYINRSWLIIIGAVLALLFTFFRINATASAADCATPSPDLGIVTETITLSTSGTYRVWSRIMASNETNNSFLLEIDGTSCFTVGDSTIPSNTWTWVDYQSATSSSKINLSLNAGKHTIRMIGTEAGVKLDRILLLSSTTCTPSATGTNCETVGDNTKPQVAIISPTAGSTVTGKVSVIGSASDAAGIEKVELSIDGNTAQQLTNKETDRYAGTLDFKDIPNGSHTISLTATDVNGNSASASHEIIIANNIPDKTKPQVNITAPANNSIITTNLAASANATDNNSVTTVEFLLDNKVIGSDDSAPYAMTYALDNMTNGSHYIAARATDASGNATTSNAVAFTVQNQIPLKQGDANGDSIVNIIDLSVLATNFGATGVSSTQGDLTGDGIVNIFDLSVLATNWGD